MLKPVLIAAALLATTSAHAQKADEFRQIASSDQAVVMASTLVTGPQTARQLNEVLVPRNRTASGVDAFAIQVTLDCKAGTVTIGTVTVYQDNKVIGQIPQAEDATNQPGKGSLAYDLLTYGCTGSTGEGDPARPIGVLAAIAHAQGIQRTPN